METGSDQYYSYWGKTRREGEPQKGAGYHLLVYHCLDVAAVGLKMLEYDRRLCDIFTNSISIQREHLLRILTFYLAIHDIGKFSHHFQSLNEELIICLQSKKPTRLQKQYHPVLGYHLYCNVLWDEIWNKNLLNLDTGSSQRKWHNGFRYFASATTGHHGSPPQLDNDYTNLDKYFDHSDIQAATAFMNDCIPVICGQGRDDIIPFSKNLNKQIQKYSWLFAGLVVVSDWIGSNTIYFPYCSDKISLTEYWDYALKKAEIAIKETGLLPSIPSSIGGMRQLFGINTPSDLQRYAETADISSGPHLYIMEESTGSGKTEAALVLAHRLLQKGEGEGIYFALPTMATTNAIYIRLREAYTKLFAEGERPTLILAHGSRNQIKEFRQSLGFENQKSDISPEGELETASAYCSAWLGDNRKKALLGSIGVGTLDQALMAILPKRYQSLRLLGLSRSILIVDEVHAYDAYMNGLLEVLLKFHAALGGSAILLSATLPYNSRSRLVEKFYEGMTEYEQQRSLDSINDSEQIDRSEELTQTKRSLEKKEDFPLVTHIRGRDKPEEIEISTRLDCHREIGIHLIHSLSDVDALVQDGVAKDECVCVIKNTVTDAIDTYDKLVKLFGPDRITLFHARFAMEDRLRIEEKVTTTFGPKGTADKRRGQIVIATQVVEQSLDLDFDHMITDLAPIDLIIQRAGRLHRHSERWPGRSAPVLVVLTPEIIDDPDKFWYSRMFPRGAYVYKKNVTLWRTACVLQNYGALRIPEEARDLIEDVYDENRKNIITPPALWDADVAEEGIERSRSQIARFNSLNFDEGYYKNNGPSLWGNETNIPTRLGEETITLRLAKWVDDGIVPWSDSDENAWIMSDVNVPKGDIVKSLHSETESIERAKMHMPDRGRWCIVIPLKEESKDLWVGFGEKEDGTQVPIYYYPFSRGLVILKDREK
ncbi:CRISPR-associated helicase Cas3' [Methanosphaerula subterraneus]|uniref:CRISPR-associated helicase Cas3' n=1 Tax=Methanosphaerula subterraneus TaxID=3350244 RepID=UPI003F867735